MSDDFTLSSDERALIEAIRRHDLPTDQVRRFLTYDLPTLAERGMAFCRGAFSDEAARNWTWAGQQFAENALLKLIERNADPAPEPDAAAEAACFDRLRPIQPWRQARHADLDPKP